MRCGVALSLQPWFQFVSPYSTLQEKEHKTLQIPVFIHFYIKFQQNVCGCT